ncbi:T9SS type A sorting domain-containing protein [Tenacibaculum sp. M341]|uniref:T9SS type A sorting domain-containing protein n=1 Tax=Tenacibaculum sp. M341 TaxID=2530339 RepID=UPI001053FF80|nr:T9SS type A sorting domain-containing protein [Tenacibaculum sp. M341]TCI93514.1 T9SS type A sorting domain-containing protein [Tenacibaculum sp. M341]
MKKKYIIPCLIILHYISILVMNAQTTNEITINRNGVTFTFSFDCNGGPCEYGKFVTGDYWIATNTPIGKVNLNGITPSGEINGAMLNPDLLRNSSGELISLDNQKQGILNMYDHYSSDLNLMTQLPANIEGNSSVFKISTRTSNCGTRAIEDGCVDTAVVLTILKEVPENRGANLFRPPFHGKEKPFYTTDKVKLNRLPKLSQVSNGTNGIIGGVNGYEHWLVPQIDLYHGGMGEFHRATIPHASQTPYAADQAKDFLDDLGNLFGKESDEEKRAAVYSLLQKGIDNYAIYKMGVSFQSGAGQHLGKKPPITLLGALYDDTTIFEDIRSIASNKEAIEKRFFQEDAQVKMGKSGMAIWGDELGVENIHWYFARMYPNIDTQGSAADPYGYIDGPAGGIHPDDTQTRDRNYMGVAGGPIIGYAFLQHLMPWFKHAAGDEEVLLWSDRIYKGYGIDGFDGGLWTLPDPVAPRDLNESGNCKPFKLYSTGISECTKYMQTWGPVESNLEEFIGHGKDPNTHGRMPELHGTKINFNRLPSLTRNLWNDLRPCSDPNNASYPCEGLGELPEAVLSTDEINIEKETELSLSFTKDTFKITTIKNYSEITVDLYSILGKELTTKKDTGNSTTLKLSKKKFNTNSLYVYRVSLDGEVYSGKFLLRK